MDNYKCRLCLEESSRNINIFKEKDFSLMIELLTGLKVDPGDGLPSNSCLQCHKEVKSAMLTRYQIINSYKVLIADLNSHNEEPSEIKPKSFGFLFTPINEINKEPNKIDISSKALCNDNLNASINNSDTVKHFKDDINTEKSNEFLFSEFKLKELSEQKDLKLKCDNSTNDCYQSSEDSCEENEKSDISSCESKNSQEYDKGVNNAAVNPMEIQKNTSNKLVMKLRSNRTVFNQEIKFKRKRADREKPSHKKVQFRKKRSANPYHVKVNYDIKPEHIEFLKSVGKKDRVPCPICKREIYGMNMKNHLITHNFDPVICDTCGKTSKNAQALQDHINYYHKTTPDRFMCDKCGKGYRVRFMLERHEKKEHGNGEKDYECTVCGKKFFEKLQLKNHINITHNKIKPFKCEHCGKDFGRRTQFVTHQLVHTKENRYHCQVCGKGFKIKQTMQTHLKGVHGIEEEKTIFCKICQKGFSSAQGLRAHVNSRVHGLEKCEHCSEFITLEYKDVHLRDIHGIKTENVYNS